MLTESNGKLVGSARTVRGFDIYQAIHQCEELLENFGGHVHAAGLTLKKENFEAFQQKFETVVASKINAQQEIPEIPISMEMPITMVNDKFYKILKQFAPFGPKNRNPNFISREVRDAGFSRLLKGNHLKLSLRQNEKDTISGIAFGQGALIEKIQNQAFHICYNIVENHWQGRRSLQVNVKDVKF